VMFNQEEKQTIVGSRWHQGSVFIRLYGFIRVEVQQTAWRRRFDRLWLGDQPRFAGYVRLAWLRDIDSIDVARALWLISWCRELLVRVQSGCSVKKGQPARMKLLFALI
jgi:hypothetical protein